MNHSTSKTGLLLIAAMIAAAGYMLGAAHSPAPLHAQAVAPGASGGGTVTAIAPAEPAPAPGVAAPGIAVGQDIDSGMQGVIGVSIPSGGAALVKGKDGHAYVVDTRGMYVRASQSGKPLPLP